jgi:hypothetical protein
MTNANKRQVGGDHYLKYTVQPWDIAKVYGLDFMEHCALKYILRRKGDRKGDLQKAIHYLEKKIEWIDELAISEKEERVKNTIPQAPKKSVPKFKS